MTNYSLLPEEKEVLEYLRSGEYGEIKVRKRNGKISLIELTQDSCFEDIFKIIKASGYEDIQLTKTNGKIVKIKRVIKKKPN